MRVPDVCFDGRACVDVVPAASPGALEHNVVDLKQIETSLSIFN